MNKRITPTPPASPERLAMAGRLNPPPSRGREMVLRLNERGSAPKGGELHGIMLWICKESCGVFEPAKIAIMQRGGAIDHSRASSVHRHRKLEAPNHPGAADR